MASRESHIIKCGMRRRASDERGAFMVIFALMLLVLLGFTALGIEAGRWYLVRAELAKGVDAAALVGARNISNPYVTPDTLAEEFGKENFQSGYIGTPGSGTGEVQFTANLVGSDKVHVRGDVNATAVLAQLFGVGTIPVSAESVAQKKEVEIMMILDQSGSMDGSAKIGRLRTAATTFVSYFQETQDKDKMGLITFDTTARVRFPLGTNYVNSMTSAINGMCPGYDCNGATNAEDALDQSDGPQGFTDQTGVPGDKRIQQFVVFFSDGMPTALRDRFKYNNTTYDAVVYGQGTSGHANCRTSDYPYMSVADVLTRPDGSGTYSGNPATTGDGKATSGTNRTVCTSGGSRYLNTKWYLFETTLVPRSGGGTWPAEQCSIPMTDLVPYFCGRARQLALDNAAVLKAKGIKIYVIGLGTSTEIDTNYLQSLSSGTTYTYITPNSSELQAIFSKIAKEIKLRLVQ